MSKPQLTEPITPITKANRHDEERMALLLGRVLRAGVIAASATIISGIVVAVVGGDGVPSSLDAALGRDPTVESASIRPADLVRGVGNGDASALIQLGLLLLILTPTVRVALTTVVFFRQRDRVLAGLASLVLAILVLGLVGIGA